MDQNSRSFVFSKKQKKQKGEPGMRTAIFPENGRRMMSEMMCMCRCMCMSYGCCGKEKCAPDVSGLNFAL